MKLVVPFTYTEIEIPKRCRYPRPVQHAARQTVEIREVRYADAPVAIIEYDSLYKQTFKLRWFEGQLWCDKSSWNRGREDQKYPIPTAESYHDSYSLRDMNRDKGTADITAWGKDHLLIGGRCFRTHGEPRWVVMTFGLGCNHGGTALMVDHGYNSNIDKARYFPISKRDEAMAEAKRIALARGDTKSIPIDPDGRFDILIPEAVRCNPSAQHSDGDPFINQIEGIVEGIQNPAIAGLMGLMLAIQK